MEAVARGGASYLHRRIPLGVLTAIAIAVLAVLAYESTRPYDPLAAGQSISAAAGDALPGQTFTAIYPLIAQSGERATILGVTAVANRDTRLIGLHGVSTAREMAVNDGGARATAMEAGGTLRPLPGLRFTTADPSSSEGAVLATHVWVAETVTVLRGHGCLDLPALRLRYRVGGTDFTRTLPAPVQLAGVSTDTSSCTTPAF